MPPSARATPTPDRWLIQLPVDKPLSLNARQHHMAKASDVASLREDTRKLARQLPRCRQVRTWLIYEPRKRQRRDPINLVATLKVAQDGLVDAGVVPDDTPEHMASEMPLIDHPDEATPYRRRRGKVWLLVERLA